MSEVQIKIFDICSAYPNNIMALSEGDMPIHRSAKNLLEWMEMDDYPFKGDSLHNVTHLLTILEKVEDNREKGDTLWYRIKQSFSQRNTALERRKEIQGFYDLLSMGDQHYLLKHSMTLSHVIFNKGSKIDLLGI